MGSFAANLESQLSTALSGSTPDSPPTPSSPEPSQSTAPASTPTETAPTVADPIEDFEFPDETSVAPPVEEEPEPATEGEKPPEHEENDRIRKAFLETSRGKRQYAAFQLGQALEKPPSEGGIGRIPTLDEFREMNQKAADLELMAHEFHNGNPQYAENFIKNWFQPRDLGNGQIGYTPGAMQAAQKFMPTLDSMARDMNQPEAYREAARQAYVKAAIPVVSSQINDMYARAFAEPDVDTRLHLLNGARIWEHDIYGQMRELPPGIDKAEYTPGGQQAAPDPRSAEIDGRIRYINEFEQRQQQQHQSQFMNAFNATVDGAITGDETAALAVLKEAYTPREFQALQSRFHAELKQGLDANPAQLRAFKIARDNARANPSEQNIKTAADALRSVARPIIRQLRSQYVKDAQPRITAASAKRHATLEESAQKTGTASVAQPVGKNLAPALARNSGETWTEMLERATRERISQAS